MRFLLLRRLFLTTVILTFISLACKKRDWDLQPGTSGKKDDISFFTAYRPNSSAAQAVLNFTQRKNEQYHFAANYLKKIGKPRWDKALVFDSKVAARISASTEDSTIVYIPFVRDSQYYVNASLMVKMKSSDTTFRMLYDWQYQGFGFEEPLDAGPWRAATVMQAFMQMDKEVFGTTEFRVKDARLLPAVMLIKLQQSGRPFSQMEVIAQFGSDANGLSVAGRTEITTCTITKYCTKWFPVAEARGSYVEGENSVMSGMDPCMEYSTRTFCTTIWVDGGGDGTGGGSGGTGGGGGSGGGSGGTGGGTGGGGWTNPDPPVTPPDCPQPDMVIGPDGSCIIGWEPVIDPYAELAEMKMGNDDDAAFHGCSTYIIASGVAITLPPGSRISTTYGVDTDIFPNGALYRFSLPVDGQPGVFDDYVAIQDEYRGAGALVVPNPEFKRFFRIDPVKHTITKDTLSVSQITIAKPEPGKTKINAVRVRIQKRPDGRCERVREIVEYEPSVLPVSIGVADPSYEVQYLPVLPQYAAETKLLETCPGQVPAGTPGVSLEQFKQSKGAQLAAFFKDRLHSDVKVYLYDCATNQAKYTIDKNGVTAVPDAQQTAQLQKFDNDQFTATDEEIAIKACINKGEWKSQTKFNYTRLGNLPPKVTESFNELLTELNYQANQAVKHIRGVNRSTESITIEGDDGEKFFKESMGFFETLGSIYDIGKHVFKESTLPEFLWNQGRTNSGTDATIAGDYLKSPLKMPSVIAGAADQLIEEVTGVVQLLKTGCEVVSNPKAAYDNIYSTIRGLNREKIKQFISSATGYDNYQVGGDRARYQGGRHGVQAVMILSATIKLVTKGPDVVRQAGKEINDIQSYIPDGSTNHPASHLLKNAIDNKLEVRKIDDDKILTSAKINNERHVVGMERNVNDVKVYTVKETDLVDHRTGHVYTEQEIFESAKDFDKPSTTSIVNGIKVVETDAGSSGNWNKKMNKPEKSAVTKVKNTGHKYTTDAIGRVTKVEGELKLQTRDRNGWQQSVKCKATKDGLPDDHGGHLIASIFDGAGEQINLLPMKSSLNLGVWKSMENTWKTALQQGKPVKVDIRPIYDGNSLRPVRFEVRYQIDGANVILETFEN